MTDLFYFVHSTTIDNEQGIATGWHQGELSSKGLLQSTELATTLAAKTFDAYYSSDLRRALQSPRIMFPNAKPQTDWRLRECNYGDLNGHPISEFKHLMLEHIATPYPNGESYMESKTECANS